MNEDELGRLKQLQTEIYGEYGVWGSTGLARSCEQAAAEPLLAGTAVLIEAGLAQELWVAARELYDAAEVLADVAKLQLDGAWAGSAHTAAATAVQALHDDVKNAQAAYGEISTYLRIYGPPLQGAITTDAGGQSDLSSAAAAAAELTWGSVPKIAGLGYDGEEMRAAHAMAMMGINSRVDSHTRAIDNARELISNLHEVATKARSGIIRSGLSNLDNLLIATAGGTTAEILTPAMEKRAAAAVDAMGISDRERWNALLTAAKSPEQQAYLFKALAAGYSLDKITQFNSLIADEGTNPEWLAEHLNPLVMDSDDPNDVKNANAFNGAAWSQGQDPTCVAASTVTARAQIDPLYALQLTTGGHPGDPNTDNPAAFADRLHAEQQSVYDDGRHWYENWGHDGMTDDQSQTIADQQIAAHTGTSYTNVDMDDQQARDTTMRSVERAVDDGYPVPLSVDQAGGDGHQMMVIGHVGDKLEIYNPWGYTYWVSENDFVAGHVDGIDADIPSTPTSVRLPQETN
jgi:hypothetical protein